MDSNTSWEGTLQGYLDPSRYQEMTSIPCLNGLVYYRGHRKNLNHGIFPWNHMKYGGFSAFQNCPEPTNPVPEIQDGPWVRAPEIHPTGSRHPTPWHTSIDRRERPLSLWTSGRSQRPPSNLGNIRQDNMAHVILIYNMFIQYHMHQYNYQQYYVQICIYI